MDLERVHKQAASGRAKDKQQLVKNSFHPAPQNRLTWFISSSGQEDIFTKSTACGQSDALNSNVKFLLRFTMSEQRWHSFGHLTHRKPNSSIPEVSIFQETKHE